MDRQTHNEHKEREKLMRLNICEERRQFMEHRLIIREELDKETRKRILEKAEMKQMQAAQNRKEYYENRKKEQQKKREQAMDAKRDNAAEQAINQKEMEEQHRAELKRRAERRQQKMEKFREELPNRMAKKKEKEKHLEDIVRKYAMRWLNRVRARLKRDKMDDMHQSFYQQTHPNGLKDLVKYLQEKSGYEKLDDVVMNILKFKEALKRQMLLEELEENTDEDDYDE